MDYSKNCFPLFNFCECLDDISEDSEDACEYFKDVYEDLEDSSENSDDICENSEDIREDLEDTCEDSEDIHIIDKFILPSENITGVFTELAEIKLKIDLNNYKSDEHKVGYKVTSEDIYVEREPGTKWNIVYYPCGYNEQYKNGIGMCLSSKSIQSSKGQVHAHCAFQIIAGNRELTRTELSYVYSFSNNIIGFASILSRSLLPDKFTLRACIQWSPVPQIFYQPSAVRSIDRKVSTVVARWNIEEYRAGRQNYMLSSPVFGHDGVLWNIKADPVCVHLVNLPKNIETITAKVSFTFGNNSSSEEQSEEKEYKLFTCSKRITLPEEHKNNPEIIVTIIYCDFSR